MKSIVVFRRELKVCEGCGALWVRPLGQGVYCKGCVAMLSEFPRPRGERRRVKGTSIKGRSMGVAEARA